MKNKFFIIATLVNLVWSNVFATQPSSCVYSNAKEWAIDMPVLVACGNKDENGADKCYMVRSLPKSNLPQIDCAGQLITFDPQVHGHIRFVPRNKIIWETMELIKDNEIDDFSLYTIGDPNLVPWDQKVVIDPNKIEKVNSDQGIKSKTQLLSNKNIVYCLIIMGAVVLGTYSAVSWFKRDQEEDKEQKKNELQKKHLL